MTIVNICEISFKSKIKNKLNKNIFTKNDKALLGIVKTDSNDLKWAVKKVVDLIGGFEKLDLKNKKVLLKPNFNTADPFPASSDPEFLRAVIELIKGYNPAEIIMADSSTITLSTAKVIEKMGIWELGRETGVKIIDLDRDGWQKVKIPNGKYFKKISVPKIINEVDKLILLPCLKTHHLARFTMSIKLTAGYMKKVERIALHFRNLEYKIAELASLFHPDLIILDGRKCFITEGPEHGEVREPNIIMASGDRIALDVEALKILKSYPAKNKLDLDPWEFPQIKKAVELGLGSKSEDDYLVIKE